LYKKILDFSDSFDMIDEYSPLRKILVKKLP